VGNTFFQGKKSASLETHILWFSPKQCWGRKYPHPLPCDVLEKPQICVFLELLFFKREKLLIPWFIALFCFF
jgi:hypothetical protein